MRLLWCSFLFVVCIVVRYFLLVQSGSIMSFLTADPVKALVKGIDHLVVHSFIYLGGVSARERSVAGGKAALIHATLRCGGILAAVLHVDDRPSWPA